MNDHENTNSAAVGRSDSKALLSAIAMELDHALYLAENELVAERLSGNIVKEEYWKGECAALHRIRRIIDSR